MLLLPLAVALTGFFWGLFIYAAPEIDVVAFLFALYALAMASSLWVLHEAIDLAFAGDLD